MVKTKLFKRLGLTFLVLCAAISVCTFASCAKSDKEESNVENGEFSTEQADGENSAETTTFDERKSQIVSDFLKFKGKDEAAASYVEILGYFGTYNETDIVCVDAGEGRAFACCYEMVDGIRFNYPEPIHIYAYNDGNFYIMQEAVDKGFLTHEDVENIRGACIEQNFAVAEDIESFEIWAMPTFELWRDYYGVTS